MRSRFFRFCRQSGLVILLVAQLVACQTPPSNHGGFSDEQIAVMRKIGFTDTNGNWSLKMDGAILFDSDTDRLTPSARDTIGQVVTMLESVGIDRMRVEGHTDSTGDARYNQSLSERRAETVAREIESHGFHHDRVIRRGLGDKYPIADNTTTEGRAQNRRVVLIVPVE